MAAARIQLHGTSRSFQPGDPFFGHHHEEADILVLLGDAVGPALAATDLSMFKVVLVELDRDCLGALTGEDFGREGGNVVGVARYRIGPGEQTQTIELVVQPHTDREALEAARALLEEAGFAVAVCNDVPGRILDRLMRPYLNLALESLDRGIADANALDSALTKGLGYKRGPITILDNTGLDYHHAVTAHLHAVLGQPSYLPPRRAAVAAVRSAKND